MVVKGLGRQVEGVAVIQEQKDFQVGFPIFEGATIRFGNAFCDVSFPGSSRSVRLPMTNLKHAAKRKKNILKR